MSAQEPLQTGDALSEQPTDSTGEQPSDQDSGAVGEVASAGPSLPLTDAPGSPEVDTVHDHGDGIADQDRSAPDEADAVDETDAADAAAGGAGEGLEEEAEDDDEGDHGEGEDHEGEDDDAENDDSAPGSAAASGGLGRGKRPLSPERTEQLEREGEIAADFLERLLDIADMDGDIDVDIDGDRAAVAIVDSEEGRVPRRLVGQDGKVLEALQELARLAVQAETGDRSRLMLDVAGHRAGRRRVVIGEAREAIAEIRAGAERVEMKPMTAFERKVAHDEILAAGLVSESDGVEPGRFVVVYPA